MKRVIRSVIIFLTCTFVIGNTSAFLQGAWPIEFAPLPLTPEQTAFRQELEQTLAAKPTDFDSALALGTLLFLHNDLDEADRHLAAAHTLRPDDPEALAWYSANKAKRAGAMLDLAMGLFKLALLNEGLDGLDRAVASAPDNAIVRVNRLSTLVRLDWGDPVDPRIVEDAHRLFATHGTSATPDDLQSVIDLNVARGFTLEARGLEDAAARRPLLDRAQTLLDRIKATAVRTAVADADIREVQDALDQIKA